MTRFSGELAAIAELVGEPSAVLIAAKVGGTRVYIPARVSDGHWLVECIGREKAEKICAHYAIDDGKRGTRIDIPLAGAGVYPQLRRAVAKRVHELDMSKASASKIARSVGVTERTVHAHRAAHRGRRKGRQGVLL